MLRATGNVLLVTAYKSCGLLLTLGLTALQAAAFGASPLADAFYFARQFLASAAVLIESWMQKLLVPGFLHAAQTDQVEQRLVQLFLRVALAGLALAAGLWLLSDPVVRLLAPGFENVQFDTAVELFQISLVGIPAAMIIGLFTALRFSRRRFGVASMLSLLPRLFGLAAFVVVGLGLGVHGLMWWIVAGTASAAAILAFLGMRTLFRQVDRDMIGADTPRPSASRMAAVSVFSASQFMLAWANVALASLGAAGTVAMMFLGLRLINAAPGMTNAAISTVYYTEYADAALNARNRQARTIASGVRLSFFFAVPFAGLLLVAAEPIARLVLEHGQFDADATRSVAQFVVYMVPTLVLNALFGVQAAVILADEALPAFRIMTAALVAGLAVRVAIGFLAVPHFGLAGLAAAIIVSSALPTVWFHYALRKAYGRILLRHDIVAIGLVILAAGIPALAVWKFADLHNLFGCIVYGVLYGGLVVAFRVPEALVIFAKVPAIGRMISARSPSVKG